MMRFQVSSFFCWDLATGAKFIGALGLLAHSLAILVIYRIVIDLWVLSNEKDGTKIPTIVFTLAAVLLFIGLIINILSIVLSYRLFKINETNQIQDLTSWINAELVSWTLFVIYFAVNVGYTDFGVLNVGRFLSLALNLYFLLCVMSLREEYRQRAGLLSSTA